MFTGLIEKIGKLAAVERSGGAVRLRIDHPPWEVPIVCGDSVAVNGACLTAASVSPESFAADLLEETVSRTALLERSGASVNLERAVQAGARFGGHFVTGHVDGVGTVTGIEARGRDHVLTVRCRSVLLAEMVVKGSVACDGVSLTIVRIDAESFDLHLVPFTWEHTALRFLNLGAGVNLETDLIGKYVRHCVSSTAGGTGGVRMDDLRNAGILT